MAVNTIQANTLAELIKTYGKNRTSAATISNANTFTDNVGKQTPPQLSNGAESIDSGVGYAGTGAVTMAPGDAVMKEDHLKEKQEKILRAWNIALSILAIVFTLIFGVIGYFSTTQLVELSTNTTQLSSKAVRNSEISLALSNLISYTASRSYITGSQKQASLTNPPLVLPDVKGGYELTPNGKQMLIKANLWGDVTKAVKESPQSPTNEVILSLGIDRLYNDAVNQGLTIDKLIGVSATLIEQSR